MKVRFVTALALVGALAVGSGCQKGGAGDILVGEYSSLTGTTATFGQSTDNGIKMAFDEINKAGGVLGKKLAVAVEDDQSKPEEAATAATKLINQNHVVRCSGRFPHRARSPRLRSARPREFRWSRLPRPTPGSLKSATSSFESVSSIPSRAWSWRSSPRIR